MWMVRTRIRGGRVRPDIIGERASCAFDAGLTKSTGPIVEVFGWYDDEWAAPTGPSIRPG